MPSTLRIGNRRIGRGAPCFVIAEAGVNHNGSVVTARKLIKVARTAGADAVKFQTFSADRLASPSAPKAAYQRRSGGSKESQLDMLRRLELSEKAHRKLKTYADQLGIIFLSSPFDELSADFLESLDVPAFKIPSGELTNIPFLEHVARKGKPMIVSTGMSTMLEVQAAVKAIRAAGDPALALLHCVSSYPAFNREVNLRAMETLGIFDVPVGYSDHTLGTEIALAAVARGACVIEKHFTLDRSMPGPDHLASLVPNELQCLVYGIRAIESSLGDGRKIPAASEEAIRAVARKSLVAAVDIIRGTTLSRNHVVIQRPGTGMAPTLLPRILGRRARVAIRKGTLLREGMLE